MAKVKSYCVHKPFTDSKGESHVVLVYGELTLENFGKKQLKSLNFGHAICCQTDEFDFNKGIRLAKKRFYTDDITTFNHNFLNDDMVNAILGNEIDYIIEHLDKYLPSEK